VNDEAIDTDAPAETRGRKRLKTPAELTNLQTFVWAGGIVRDVAERLTDSPRVVTAAAAIAFEMLEPEVQLELLTKARMRQSNA
jgi:hypothetical protein